MWYSSFIEPLNVRLKQRQQLFYLLYCLLLCRFYFVFLSFPYFRGGMEWGGDLAWLIMPVSMLKDNSYWALDCIGYWESDRVSCVLDGYSRPRLCFFLRQRSLVDSLQKAVLPWTAQTYLEHSLFLLLPHSPPCFFPLRRSVLSSSLLLPSHLLKSILFHEMILLHTLRYKKQGQDLKSA